MKKTTLSFFLGCALVACSGERDDNGTLGNGANGTGGDDGGDDGSDGGTDDGGDDGDGGTGTGGDDGDGSDGGTGTGGDGSDGDTDTGGGGICGPSDGSGGQTGRSSMQVDGSSVWYDVPSSYSDAEAVPMVVTMHGSGDSADNFVHWFPDANVPETVITLTPGSKDPQGWDEPDVAVVLSAIDEMTVQYNVDTCRIYIMGFSAGASMSYIIGLQHADEFAGFGSVAGNIQYAESWGIWPDNVPRKIAVDIHHGTLDGIEGARYSRDQLEGAGHKVYYKEMEGVGHTVNAQMAAEMWANLKSHSVDE